MQNIPSHTKEIRLMFTAGHTINSIQLENDSLTVLSEDEIEIEPDIWKLAKNLSVGDVIYTQEDDSTYLHKEIKQICVEDSHIKFLFN